MHGEHASAVSGPTTAPARPPPRGAVEVEVLDLAHGRVVEAAPEVRLREAPGGRRMCSEDGSGQRCSQRPCHCEESAPVRMADLSGSRLRICSRSASGSSEMRSTSSAAAPTAGLRRPRAGELSARELREGIRRKD